MRILIPSLLAALVALPIGAAENPPRPNILYLYVDDMGWGSIGPNGQAARRAMGKPSVRTPNLDRLAAEGVNFTRGYGCHVCSPARSSQQTGFHQGHTWADRNDPDNAKKAIRADDICMGDALSAAGYATGYWGKWGYGGSKDMARPTLDNLQTLPTSHGYRHVLAELHHVRAHTFFQPTLWFAPAPPGAAGGLALVPNTMAGYARKAAYPDTPARQNHPRYPKTAYCDDVYAFAALDFVRNQAQSYRRTGQPFFGLLAVQIPHAPFGEIADLPQWAEAYQDDPHFADLPAQARQWAAMVTRIDAHFGNLLAALEDPNHDGDRSDSVARDTLVLFQSDNGGPGGSNNPAFDANGGLTGTKGKIQEGGIRVPLIMRWPARIHADSDLEAGTNSDRVVDVTDLLPTFCELAGAPIPLGIDGVSIAPTLFGEGHQRRRAFIIHEAGNGQSIIRGNHKLVRVASKKGKTTFQLFDLAADRSEKQDIAAAHPQRVALLKALLLGERVDEPKGFANTYHRWTGGDGAATSDADNWSDYAYANADIVYHTDDGAPGPSWIAHMANRGKAPSSARVDADLEVLALEVRGAGEAAPMTLALGEGIGLTGRNEIRLASHGHLAVDGGTVASLRWVDIQPGATLGGHGRVQAVVYNHGKLAAGSRSLAIEGDYHGTPSSTLALEPSGGTPLQVKGKAALAGSLMVVGAKRLDPKPGTSVSLLTADRIEGRFDRVDLGPLADRYEIGYTATAVSLTARP